MNITEFAIGNYVLLSGVPERVRGIQEDQFEEGRHVLLLGQGKVPLWYTLKEIEPIRLSPSVLNVFGLVFDCNTRKGPLYTGYGYTIYFDFSYTAILIGGNTMHISTLHELTNQLSLLLPNFILSLDYDKLKAAI